MAIAKSLQPDQWWIPLKSIDEERFVRENLKPFIELFLMRFGYGSPQTLEVAREENDGSWSAKFTATINSNIIKGEVTYLPASNSLILSISA
jgi:hypothetical protein